MSPGGHDVEVRPAALIRDGRTLVLSTADPDPWAAPVYYVYGNDRLYFFSNPNSRHVIAAMTSGTCAGAIFHDGDDWRDIEGIQMSGGVEQVPPGAEADAAFRSYVAKFPTVKEFFAGTEFDLARFSERFRSRLYAFVPLRVFYVNNRAGFAKRTEVRLTD